MVTSLIATKWNSSDKKPLPVFVVMPDFGGAYLWINRGVPTTEMTNAFMAASINLERKIPKRLEGEFKNWQRDFEDAFETFSFGGAFDWLKFHNKGVMLAVKLKHELGERARVYYEKPYEDPNCHLNGIREVLANGRLI